MKAIWNNKVIAESDAIVTVENNHYFSQESVNMEYLKKSGNKYTCPWKGNCDYYDVVVDGKVGSDSAWMYPEPSDAAKKIKGHFAFQGGVEIIE